MCTKNNKKEWITRLWGIPPPQKNKIDTTFHGTKATAVAAAGSALGLSRGDTPVHHNIGSTPTFTLHAKPNLKPSHQI